MSVTDTCSRSRYDKFIAGKARVCRYRIHCRILDCELSRLVVKRIRLFRNDYYPNSNIRTCYGTAVYVKNTLTCLTTPTRFNMNDVEITVTVLKEPIPNLHIIGIYRSKNKVALQVLIDTLNL